MTVKLHNGFLAVTAALALAVASASCGNTAEGVKKDTAEAKADAKEAGADAKAASADATAGARAEAKDESADAKRAAGNAGAAVDAAIETLDVKKALMADSTVDASNINVDTFHDTKTVVLKGHVPSAAMKTEAARIATREAKGYKVTNELTVKP
jgi:osmotically-inducible protein OsmY